MNSTKDKNNKRSTILNLWHEYQWMVVGLLGLFAAILGFIGYQKHYLGLNQPQPVWDTLYSTLQLFSLNFQTIRAACASISS